MKNIFSKFDGLKIAKIVIWSVPFFVAIIILNRIFVPGGDLVIKYDVLKDSPIIENFAAKEPYTYIGESNLANSPKEPFQLITTTPMYFDLKVPRAFAKATVSMKYQNPDDQPKIVLGVQQSNEAYYYNDMALYNEKLENLDDHWNKITEGDVTLWQKDFEYFNAKKEKMDPLDEWYESEFNRLEELYPEGIRSLLDEKEFKNQLNSLDQQYTEEKNKIIDENIHLKSDKITYDSVDAFFDNFPAPENVLEYNYNLSNFLEMPGYQPSDKMTEINKSMRGSQEILTYLGEGEDLNFIFTIQDANRHPGEDIMTIKVYNSQNELIEEVSAPDDGVTEANGEILAARRHQLVIEDMPFGTYRLEIDIPLDDTFIKKIQTYQHLLVFNKHVYLTDNVEYAGIVDENNISPTTLYTNSNYVSARTAHENGLQVLRVGNYNLRIDDLHVMNEIDTEEGIVPVITPKNDIFIEGNGYFAFSKEQLFDPYFSLIKSINEIEKVNDYDYIITDYPRPATEGEWQVAQASISSPYLYLNSDQQNVYHFIIDFPGLPENDRQIFIKDIEIRLEKEPINISNFIIKFKNWLNRVRS